MDPKSNKQPPTKTAATAPSSGCQPPLRQRDPSPQMRKDFTDPPRTLFHYHGFAFEFFVGQSNIPGAGKGVFVRCKRIVRGDDDSDGGNDTSFVLEAGELIDCGVYGRLKDLKSEALLNYVLGCGKQMCAFSMDDKMVPVGNDCRMSAWQRIVPFVNETNDSEAENFHVEIFPDEGVHFVLGHKGERNFALPANGEARELLMKYGTKYETVRSSEHGRCFDQDEEEIANDLENITYDDERNVRILEKFIPDDVEASINILYDNLAQISSKQSSVTRALVCVLVLRRNEMTRSGFGGILNRIVILADKLIALVQHDDKRKELLYHFGNECNLNDMLPLLFDDDGDDDRSNNKRASQADDNNRTSMVHDTMTDVGAAARSNKRRATDFVMFPAPSQDAMDAAEDQARTKVEFSIKLMLKTPEVAAALFLRTIPLFASDDNELAKKEHAVVDSLQQVVDYVKAGLAQRAKKKAERLLSVKQTMYFGSNAQQQQLLSEGPFRTIISFLDKRDMASTSKVSFEWAKASFSPDNPCWQSVDFGYGGYDRSDDDLIALLRRPQFAQVKELEGQHIWRGDQEYMEVVLKQFASVCPCLETLDVEYIPSSVATMLPALFPRLEEVVLQELENADDLTGIGEGWKSLGIVRFMVPNNELVRESEHELLEKIARFCPNLERLDISVLSSLAATVVPRLFPHLSSLGGLELQSAKEVVQYAQDMGERLKHLSVVDARVGTPQDYLDDEALSAIANACPNLRSLGISSTLENEKLSSTGLKAVVDHCPNLKAMSLDCRLQPFDWHDFLCHAARCAPSLTQLGFGNHLEEDLALNLMRESFGDRLNTRKTPPNPFVGYRQMFSLKPLGKLAMAASTQLHTK